jgi:hypothetical protein
MGCLGRVLALSAVVVAGALTGACGGTERGASQTAASAPGQDDAPGGAGDDGECCCQRYDEDGNPTGAIVSDQTACKSTGGVCTEDQSQCDNE